MVKWRKLGNTKDVVNNPLHRWLAWLDPGSSAELVAEVVKMDNAILKAQERQEHILSDEDAIRAYEMRQMAHWDYLTGTHCARDEGREEGMKEGVQKIIDLLKEGKSPEEIIKKYGKD